MNRNLKIVLIGIGLCLVSIGFAIFFEYVLITRLSDWTFSLANKFLSLYFTKLDFFLLGFFPLLLTIVMLYKKPGKLSSVLINFGTILGSMLLVILLGILIALFTWSGELDSPLLPEYIKTQPFSNYWTIFILTGIIIPLILYLKNKHSKENK